MSKSDDYSQCFYLSEQYNCLVIKSEFKWYYIVNILSLILITAFSLVFPLHLSVAVFREQRRLQMSLSVVLECYYQGPLPIYRKICLPYLD